MASISPQQSHIVIIMVASFGECFSLEGNENLSLAEIQSLGAFKKPGISIGLMGLILDYPTDVHDCVKLSEPLLSYLSNGGSKTARAGLRAGV